MSMEVLKNSLKIYCPFPIKIRKVKQIELSFDYSYVFLQENDNSSFSDIYHINCHGNIVYKYDKSIVIDSLIMPEEDKIFIPLNGFMILINLRSKTEKIIKCDIGEQKWENMFIFSKRKMFCFQ